MLVMGGFYVNNRTVYNVLTYYSYKEGELNKREDIQGHRMTLLLPNTHQEKMSVGTESAIIILGRKQVRYNISERVHVSVLPGT